MLNLLDLITSVIFVEEYKLWNSWLCTFLHPLAPSFLIDTNILFSTLFSNTFIESNNIFSFIGGDAVKVDESLFQDLEALDLDADEALDDSS
jgi:hypothetical protein